MNYTSRMAELVLGFEPAAITHEARLAAKRCILDTVATTVAGAVQPSSAKVAAYVRSQGHAGQASVVGHAWKTSAAGAALVNGTMAHALLYDDFQGTFRGHPSVPLFGAFLAIGEVEQATGAELLDAFVLGYEVSCRLGGVLNPAQYERGWHATLTQGIMGATAMVARLMKLDAVQLEYAFGIAASMASGSRHNFGTMTMGLHAGIAARNAIDAVTLAKSGFTSATGILEARMGYVALFGGYEAERLAYAVDQFADPFEMVDPGVTYKMYPSGRLTHYAIDGIFELVQAHPEIEAGSVAKIRVGTSYLIPETLIVSRATTGLEGTVCMEYCVAMALLDRRIDLASFADENLRRPEVLSLMDKVEVYVHETLGRDNPEVTKNPSLQPNYISVELHDGRSFDIRVDFHRGMPENPASWEDLTDKLMSCAALLVPEENARAIERLVADWENSSNPVATLMELAQPRG